MTSGVISPIVRMVLYFNYINNDSTCMFERRSMSISLTCLRASCSPIHMGYGRERNVLLCSMPYRSTATIVAGT